LPQPAEATGDPGDKMTALKAAIARHGILLEYTDDLGGALGESHGGRIRMLTGLGPASEFSVLTHEYAHLCTGSAYVRSRLVAGGQRRERV
jgi:hypothetical protein